MSREWTRGPQWSSHEAQKKWAPVISRASAAWSELELFSVSEKIRPSALVFLEPGEIARATADADGVGLELTPLALDATSGHRAAVHAPGLRREWLTAWKAGDDKTIGRLLGFPDCCAAHFAENWVLNRRTDTVLTQRTIAGPFETNVLLRQLGVRLVPHLPCSSDCQPSVDLGRAIVLAGWRAGVDVEALRVLLSLEVEYSALHGTAMVTTEPFRFFAGTDYTENEVKVRRPGTTLEPGPTETSWADNGFSGPGGMAQAHAVVLSVVGSPTSALDLGCGDGALLARIAAGRDGRWWGVEKDAGRSARGRVRHPHVEILTTDLGLVTDGLFPLEFDTLLLMPGRLLELRPDAADRLFSALQFWARRIVVYNYDGKDLTALCAAAGLPAPGPISVDGASSAAVLGSF